MKLPMYASEWFGIDLTALPAAKRRDRKPADPELFAQFYEKLAQGHGQIDHKFIAERRAEARAISAEIFSAWWKQHGRAPRILSLAVGTAVCEEIWLAEGYDVTLQECQEASLQDLLSRFPNAPRLIGDIRDISIDALYDVVCMLGLDTTLACDELITLFRRIADLLSADGLLLVDCRANLSFRHLITELAKRALGRYQPTTHIMWGWWRTPGALRALAHTAGMQLKAAYRLVCDGKGEMKICRRQQLLQAVPTLRDSMVMLALMYCGGERSIRVNWRDST